LPTCGNAGNEAGGAELRRRLPAVKPPQKVGADEAKRDKAIEQKTL
jgi:hypothetical protein